MIIGIILVFKFGGINELFKGEVMVIVILVCIYVVVFVWFWGLLGWLVFSEIFFIEICFVGMVIIVCVNLIFIFVIV